MNTKLRAGYLIGLLLSAASILNAQKSAVNELTSRADRQFDLYSYNLAIQTYEEVLKEDKSNAHALARIGDCHFQLNRPDKAIEWYQKAQNTFNMESDVPLRLGKALMQTSDYDGAKDQFLLYTETDEKVGRHFANVADFAIKNAKKEGQWQAKNEAINTAAADFGPAFYQSKVAFNSARTDIQPKGKPAGDIQGGNTNFLFVSQRSPDNDMLQKPVFLRSDMQNNRNEGPVSFSSNGRKVAFARNKFISGTRQIAETGMNMSIYLSDIEDGVWQSPKAFPYNGSTFGTGFPCLSPDGTKLLFASTQPGGFGGWDIYISNWTASGWSEPRNLGTPLNTPGNEVTPYFDGDYIYFSSDWHKGLGGLDVFRATLGASEITEVIHMGTGINSPRDDYGFIYNATENIGYLTSTRSGGRGNEDIWMVNKKWNDEPLTSKSEPVVKPTEYATPGEEPSSDNGKGDLHLLVTDERGFPLGDVEVDLSDCYSYKGKTGRDGKFYFDELLRPISCQISLKKSGYTDKKLEVSDFGKMNAKIAMSQDAREEFRGYVYDSKTNAPLRSVSVQVQLEDDVQETTTDENGYYSMFVEPGQAYLVSYNKNGYMDAVIRTNFPYNSNHKISNVLMDKAYTDLAVTKKDGYVDYDNTAKPVVYSDVTESGITQVIPKSKPSQEGSLTGYSIQLEATPEAVTDAKLRPYEGLTKYGNLYVKTERNLNKIRLGIYPTQAEANAYLKKVHQTDKRYKSAWVVEEWDGDKTLLVEGETPAAPAQYSTEEPVAKPDASLVRYAIQLSSFPADRRVSISDYSRMNGVGNLYSKTENGYTKVRMGIWKNYAEAESAKKIAMVRGFTDVNIITERADDPEIRDHLIPPVTSPSAPKTVKIKEPDPLAPVVYSTTPDTKPTIAGPKKGQPYLVRIAALSKPESFEVDPVEDLGTIEKRPAKNSPGMTLILIGTYSDLDTAKKVAQELIERGYKDAYVVKDENGNLVRK